MQKIIINITNAIIKVETSAIFLIIFLFHSFVLGKVRSIKNPFYLIILYPILRINRIVKLKKYYKHFFKFIYLKICN